jgi:hypothetical protein
MVALVVLAGCSFDSSGVGPDSPGGDGSIGPLADADPLQPDGSSADSATVCGGFTAAHFDACAIGDPSLAIDLAMSGTYRYDTDNGTLTDPMGSLVPHQSEVIDQGGTFARLVSIESLKLRSPATLRGQGGLPLIIASWNEIEIEGTIDFDSLRGASPGAGANPIQCETGGAQRGENDTSGGAGGGGGGFGGDGGDGGDGDGDNTLSTGGSGGIGLGQAPTIVRGGCPGAAGGDVLSPAAPSSNGGGAIQLTARTTLVVSGSIFAGGAGGLGGPQNSRCGGTGGGSGGFIGLQAPTIALTDNAQLTANGGGGGEGTSSARTGVAGENGRHDSQQASGGGNNTEFGTDGGNGGADQTPNGETVIGALESGGGGGGGGVGFIVTWTPSLAASNALVSPPATSL